DVSVVRASAGSAARSRPILNASSAAMCWASAAEPPFPKMRSLPPRFMDSTINCAARSICGDQVAKKASRASRPARTIPAIRSVVSALLSRLPLLCKAESLAADPDLITVAQTCRRCNPPAIDPDAVAASLVNDHEIRTAPDYLSVIPTHPIVRYHNVIVH